MRRPVHRRSDACAVAAADSEEQVRVGHGGADKGAGLLASATFRIELPSRTSHGGTRKSVDEPAARVSDSVAADILRDYLGGW